MTAPDLDGWIPVGLFWEGTRPVVEWARFDGLRFTDPFLDITIERAMRHPARLLFRQRTGVEVLQQRAASHPGIPPSGFIFHTSRCGSTLVAQVLAASPSNVVVSEGWPLDSVIYADAGHPEVSAADRERWLKAMISALGQPRAGIERRYFVKFDARHALDLPLVRRAFPEVPWVFVYREPVEVLVSHLNEPALWTVPGIVPVRGIPWTADGGIEYPARVTAAICQAALSAQPEGGGMLLNYTGLPGAVFSTLAAHFSCTWTDEELHSMHQAASRNAKRPGELFRSDSRRKRQEADPRIMEICDRMLGTLYRELEVRRTAPAPDDLSAATP